MMRSVVRSVVYTLLVLPLAACATEPEEPAATPPELERETISFQYPVELWDSGTEGETTLMLLVNTEGRVDSAYVEESSGEAAFDSAATRGVSSLRFSPARRDGQAVAQWVQLPVQFQQEPADDGS